MIQNRYAELVSTPSDIYQHLPTLRRYAEQCNSVTELGVRTIVSTWSWLDALVPVIRCYDLSEPPAESLKEVVDYCEENSVDFKFFLADVLETSVDYTDLLFIDTWHTYKQLTKELALHATKALKYIILHDTTLFAHVGEDGTPLGIKDALDEFLLSTDEWSVEEVFTNNNGLTVLKRIMPV